MTEKVLYKDYTDKILSDEEAKLLFELQKKLLESYIESENNIPLNEWLDMELQRNLPEKPKNEINEISKEIISSLTITENIKSSQQKAVLLGRSKESWFASTILQSTSQLSLQDNINYLQTLDYAVKKANVSMHEVITTKGSGYTIPSQNPNLDGFIAEQYHVNSFNMNAAAKGSSLKAEVQPLKPGETYTKNGFDVVIKDANGIRIHQYQMKYGATAEDTIRMLKSGNYNNQTIVVPAEQVDAVQSAFPNKTVTSTIGDGDIKSNPLTKEQAKELQEYAQNGKFKNVDWNDYTAKDVALGISKHIGYACLQGAAVGAGVEIATKVWNGEAIDGEEVVETAVLSGADFGVKTATASALKIASEKGIIKAIPKGTPASTLTNIAFVAVENAKVLGEVATGELSTKEGIEKMEQTTAACVAGLVTQSIVSSKGAAIGAKTLAKLGASIGLTLGPVGSAVGGFIGGTIGYMAGSAMGKTIAKGVQKVRETAVKTVKSIGNTVVSFAKSIARGFAGLFG